MGCSRSGGRGARWGAAAAGPGDGGAAGPDAAAVTAHAYAEMILRPPAGWAGRNGEIRLAPSSSGPLRVGRGQFGLASRTVSREHFELDWTGLDAAATPAVRVRHLADNPMRVRAGGDLTVLRTGDECILHPGDTIFVDGRVSRRAAADARNHTHALQLLVDASPAPAADDDCNWQDWEDSDDEDHGDKADGCDGADAGDGNESGEGDDEGTDSESGDLIGGSHDTESGDIEGKRSNTADVARNVACADSAPTPEPAAHPESDVTRRASAAVTPVGAPMAPTNEADLSASGPNARTGSSSSSSSSSSNTSSTSTSSTSSTSTSASQLSAAQLLDGLSVEELAALELAAQQPQEAVWEPGCSAAGVSSAQVAAAGVEMAPPAPKPLQGLRFAITGVPEVLTRDECQAMVEKHGGVFQAELRKTNRAASGRTTHLIIGTRMDDGRPVETSSKFQQARRSGIRIVKEDDLFAMVAGRDVPSRHKCSPSAPSRISPRSTAAIDRRHPSSSESSFAASSPLQAAAVRAAGGYPLSLFPESEIGTAKRRKLEMLAGHLVVLTDDVLLKVGLPRPVLPVVDEIESSDEDGAIFEAIAKEDEHVHPGTTDRRVSFRSGGAGVETLAEVTSPGSAGGDAAATLATGGSKDAGSVRSSSAAALSPVGRQRALSASAALKQTDFVLARDLLRSDSGEDRQVMPGQHSSHGAGCSIAGVAGDENATSSCESPAAAELGFAGIAAQREGSWTATPADQQAWPRSPLAQNARSPVLVRQTLQPSQPACSEQLQAVLHVASVPNIQDCGTISTVQDKRPSTEQVDKTASTSTPHSSAQSVEETITAKSPLVPESPLLSWNPGAAVVEFGALGAATSKCAENGAHAALDGGQVLVAETQATQRRERESLFVPETQMHKSDSVTAPALQKVELWNSKAAHSNEKDTSTVFVPETQPEDTPKGGDGATGDDFTSTGRVIGWLSQSVEAAGGLMMGGAKPTASPMDLAGTRGTADPTLYTASLAVQSGMDTGHAVEDNEDSSDQDRDASPFRTFPAGSSPVPRQPERLPQRQVTRARARASRGFDSGSSSDDDDEASEDRRQPDALQMKRAELHARAPSNPFSASSVSMNPVQPELSGLLRANAAPVPQRKRRAVSPPPGPRALGRRHRPVFSWTNKPQQQPANRLSQQSESSCGRQLDQTKRKPPKQQRLTSWVAR
eukprot:COSAG03_NODE_54_length_16022_cov_3.869811_4_plen_1198_part_00